MAADRPLTEAALMRRATTYLARRSASAASVRAVLTRAVARRRREGAAPEIDGAGQAAMIEAVLDRLARAGLVDDQAFARAKAGALARKGKPASAIAAELRHRHGVATEDDPSLREALRALDPLRQATRWAERKRLGPFRAGDRERSRDRDIAALARAGFPVAVARAVVQGDGSVPSGDAEA